MSPFFQSEAAFQKYFLGQNINPDWTRTAEGQQTGEIFSWDLPIRLNHEQNLVDQAGASLQTLESFGAN